MQQFIGKTAFITGASSGIGRAIAEEFGRRGLQVVLASRNLADVERVASGIKGASAVQLDVRDEGNWIEALDTAEARHGPLAVMVSNAGVSGGILPLSEMTSEFWEWSRSVNLDGAFYGLSHGARRIIASGQPGHIIATSSMAVFAPPPGCAVYIGTKAAVIGMCECLRGEMANYPVGVSVIIPGSVKSNIIDGNSSRAPESLGNLDSPAMAAVAEGVRNGLDPEVVAKQTADALGTDQFWIFTHPELEHRMDSRNADMKTALHKI